MPLIEHNITFYLYYKFEAENVTLLVSLSLSLYIYIYKPRKQVLTILCKQTKMLNKCLKC